MLNEGNPKVEETRNQLAVSYGPLTYCVEGIDLPNKVKIEDILLPVDSKFDVKFEKDLLGGVKTLTTDAYVRTSRFDENKLYAPVKSGYKTFKLKLIPYYAWSNRGEHEMSVFIPANGNIYIKGQRRILWP